MAEIEIGPLTDRLSDDEIADLARQMEKLGAPTLPRADHSEVATVGDNIDDDALTEFFDRLDVHDMAAEIYLPIEFDGSVEVGGLRVASASVLIDVLEEVKDELDVDEDEDEDEDEDDDDRKTKGSELKQLWRLFSDGAAAAIERKLPLHIKS
jgi:hypothetical protein